MALPSFVQCASGNATGATSVAATISGTTADNLLVVGMFCNQTAALTVTDNGSNLAWTYPIVTQQALTCSMRFAILQHCPGGNLTVTMHQSGTAGGCFMTIMEVANAPLNMMIGVVDQTTFNSASLSPTNSLSTVTTHAKASQAGQFCITYMGTSGANDNITSSTETLPANASPKNAGGAARMGYTSLGTAALPGYTATFTSGIGGNALQIQIRLYNRDFPHASQPPGIYAAAATATSHVIPAASFIANALNVLFVYTPTNVSINSFSDAVASNVWTLRGTIGKFNVYTCVMGATTGAVTIGLSATSFLTAISRSYSGYIPLSALDSIQVTTGSGTGTSVTTAVDTLPTSPYTLVIDAVASNGAMTTPTAQQTNYAYSGSNTDASAGSIYIQDQLLTSAATTSMAVTLGGSTTWSAIQLVIPVLPVYISEAVNGSFASVSTVTPAFVSNHAAQTLCLLTFAFQGTGGVTSIADAAGNTWSLYESTPNGASSRIETWGCMTSGYKIPSPVATLSGSYTGTYNLSAIGMTSGTGFPVLWTGNQGSGPSPTITMPNQPVLMLAALSSGGSTASYTYGSQGQQVSGPGGAGTLHVGFSGAVIESEVSGSWTAITAGTIATNLIALNTVTPAVFSLTASETVGPPLAGDSPAVSHVIRPSTASVTVGQPLIGGTEAASVSRITHSNRYVNDQYYRLAVMADSPLAYYRFDDGFGASIMTDSSGNGLNGQYNSARNLYTSWGGGIGSDPSNALAINQYTAAEVLSTTGAGLPYGTGPKSFELWLMVIDSIITLNGNFFPMAINGLFHIRLLSWTGTGINVDQPHHLPEQDLVYNLEISDGFNSVSYPIPAGNIVQINPAQLLSPFDSPTTETDFAWHHIAVTWDGTNTTRLYFDGQQIGVTTVLNYNQPTFGAQSNLIIGNQNFSEFPNTLPPGTRPNDLWFPQTGNPTLPGRFVGNSIFGAMIDEVALYGSQLSASRVLYHYQMGTINREGQKTGPYRYIEPITENNAYASGLSEFALVYKKTTSTFASAYGWEQYRESVITDAPALYWRLSEVSGAYAVDVAQSHLAPYNTITPPTLGVTGPYIVNTDNDKAVSSASSMIARYQGTAGLPAVSHGYTVEFWFKLNASLGVGQELWLYGSSLPAVAVSLTNASGTLAINVTAPDALANAVKTVIGSGPLVTDTTWHHFVMSVDTSLTTTGFASYYLDGQPLSSTMGGIGVYTQTFYPPPTDGVRMGGSYNSDFTLSQPISYALDEIAIYNAPISAARVLAHWKATRGWGGAGDPSSARRVVTLGVRSASDTVGFPLAGATTLTVLYTFLRSAVETTPTVVSSTDATAARTITLIPRVAPENVSFSLAGELPTSTSYRIVTDFVNEYVSVVLAGETTELTSATFFVRTATENVGFPLAGETTDFIWPLLIIRQQSEGSLTPDAAPIRALVLPPRTVAESISFSLTGASPSPTAYKINFRSVSELIDFALAGESTSSRTVTLVGRFTAELVSAALIGEPVAASSFKGKSRYAFANLADLPYVLDQSSMHVYNTHYPVSEYISEAAGYSVTASLFGFMPRVATENVSVSAGRVTTAAYIFLNGRTAAELVGFTLGGDLTISRTLFPFRSTSVSVGFAFTGVEAAVVRTPSIVLRTDAEAISFALAGDTTIRQMFTGVPRFTSETVGFPLANETGPNRTFSALRRASESISAGLGLDTSQSIIFGAQPRFAQEPIAAALGLVTSALRGLGFYFRTTAESVGYPLAGNETTNRQSSVHVTASESLPQALGALVTALVRAGTKYAAIENVGAALGLIDSASRIVEASRTASESVSKALAGETTITESLVWYRYASEMIAEAYYAHTTASLSTRRVETAVESLSFALAGETTSALHSTFLRTQTDGSTLVDVAAYHGQANRYVFEFVSEAAGSTTTVSLSSRHILTLAEIFGASFGETPTTVRQLLVRAPQDGSLIDAVAHQSLLLHIATSDTVLYPLVGDPYIREMVSRRDTAVESVGSVFGEATTTLFNLYQRTRIENIGGVLAGETTALRTLSLLARVAAEGGLIDATLNRIPFIQIRPLTESIGFALGSDTTAARTNLAKLRSAQDSVSYALTGDGLLSLAMAVSRRAAESVAYGAALQTTSWTSAQRHFATAESLYNAASAIVQYVAWHPTRHHILTFGETLGSLDVRRRSGPVGVGPNRAQLDSRRGVGVIAANTHNAIPLDERER